MVINTIVIKNKVTKLEIVAHYSGDFDYGLSSGESCYSITIEFNGCEYVIGISKAYSEISRIADCLSEFMRYPLAINRVTRLRSNQYDIARDSVCVNGFNKSLEIEDLRSISLNNVEDYEIDFDVTDRVWDNDKK